MRIRFFNSLKCGSFRRGNSPGRGNYFSPGNRPDGQLRHDRECAWTGVSDKWDAAALCMPDKAAELLLLNLAHLPLVPDRASASPEEPPIRGNVGCSGRERPNSCCLKGE